MQPLSETSASRDLKPETVRVAQRSAAKTVCMPRENGMCFTGMLTQISCKLVSGHPKGKRSLETTQMRGTESRVEDKAEETLRRC